VEREAVNGGFPEPLPGGWVRVVRAEHEACGGETRVRLPGQLPSWAVRRVVCQSCATPFEASAVEEVEVLRPAAAPARPRSSLPSISIPSLPRPTLPGWLSDPQSRAWRLLSLALGAAAVIAVLLLIRGGSDEAASTPFAPAEGADAPAAAKEKGARNGNAELVRESSFSVALPGGWERAAPSGGATFAAAATTGDADATLWVDRDPKLAFPSFEARSLEQLRSLAGSARVVERTAAPTADATIVRLAADAPAGSPAYEVVLRASGPYRYYLATTVQPEASRAAQDGVNLIQSSFDPTGSG
jgi:hypothetical protein